MQIRVRTLVKLWVAATSLIALPALSAQSATSPATNASPSKASLLSIKFEKVVGSIPQNQTLGQEGYGLFCVNKTPILWQEKISSVVFSRFLKHVNKNLEAAGFTVPEQDAPVFAAEIKSKEAEIELGFLIQKIQMDLCTTNLKSTGSASITGKWVLLNAKLQKIVAEIPAEAEYRTGSDGMYWGDIMDQVVSVLSSQLVKKPEFLKAINPSSELPLAQTGGLTHIFTNATPPSGGTTKNTTSLIAAVVTLETSAGSGSGFYISQDGYIITNAHVVGESKFVKVKTATGRDLPGEVLELDPTRDVALVKTARTPFEPLSIRLGDPSVGEEVFAIGSPLGDLFNGTVSRGIVSGFRGEGLYRFIQSDVSILPGNSGGPLLDAKGSVVGISTLKIVAGNQGSLSFFIPIADALSKLSIEMKSPSGAVGASAR